MEYIFGFGSFSHGTISMAEFLGWWDRSSSNLCLLNTSAKSLYSSKRLSSSCSLREEFNLHHSPCLLLFYLNGGRALFLRNFRCPSLQFIMGFHFFSRARPRTNGRSMPGATTNAKVSKWSPMEICKALVAKLVGTSPYN